MKPKIFLKLHKIIARLQSEKKAQATEIEGLRLQQRKDKERIRRLENMLLFIDQHQRRPSEMYEGQTIESVTINQDGSIDLSLPPFDGAYMVEVTK